MNNKITVFKSILVSVLIGLSGCGSSDTNSQSIKVPYIEHFSWGKVTVRHADGSLHTYQDCKVTPVGSKKWDWRETDTHHRPGIQIADVKDIAQTAHIIILTRGVDLVLQTKPETIDYLKGLGKEVHVEQTEKAIELYNKLVKEGKKVAIIIHSTC